MVTNRLSFWFLGAVGGAISIVAWGALNTCEEFSVTNLLKGELFALTGGWLFEK